MCNMCILSQAARKYFSYVALVLQVPGALLALAIVWGGVHIKTTLEEFEVIKSNYLGEVFPNLLLVGGVLMLFLHCVAFQACLSFTDWRKNFRNRTFYQMLNFLALIGLFLFLFVLFIISIFLMGYRERLRLAWMKVMRDAMKVYSINLNAKILVDKIQFEHRCCGSSGPEDWHKTPWLRSGTYPKDENYEEYVANTHKGYFVGPVVPFSCCDPRSPRACINTFYTDPTKHHNYHPTTDITISTTGCAEAFSKNVANWLAVLGEACIWCLIVEIVGLIVFRLVQTSSELALSWGDPTQDAQSYLFACGVPPIPPKADLDPEKLAMRMEILADLAFNEELNALARKAVRRRMTYEDQDIELEKFEGDLNKSSIDMSRSYSLTTSNNANSSGRKSGNLQKLSKTEERTLKLSSFVMSSSSVGEVVDDDYDDDDDDDGGGGGDNDDDDDEESSVSYTGESRYGTDKLILTNESQSNYNNFRFVVEDSKMKVNAREKKIERVNVGRDGEKLMFYGDDVSSVVVNISLAGSGGGSSGGSGSDGGGGGSASSGGGGSGSSGGSDGGSGGGETEPSVGTSNNHHHHHQHNDEPISSERSENDEEEEEDDEEDEDDDDDDDISSPSTYSNSSPSEGSFSTRTLHHPIKTSPSSRLSPLNDGASGDLPGALETLRVTKFITPVLATNSAFSMSTLCASGTFQSSRSPRRKDQQTDAPFGNPGYPHTPARVPIVPPSRTNEYFF